MYPVHAGIFTVLHHEVVLGFHYRPASPAGTMKNVGCRESSCFCPQHLQDLKLLMPVSSPCTHTSLNLCVSLRSPTCGRHAGSSIFQTPLVTLNPKVLPSICRLPPRDDLRQEKLVIKPSILQVLPLPGLPAWPRPASCTPDNFARHRNSYRE